MGLFLQTILFYTIDYMGKIEMSKARIYMSFDRNIDDIFHVVECTFVEFEKAPVGVNFKV